MKKRKDRVLMSGEITGHHHTAVAKDAEVYGDGDERELVTPTGTAVIHEEHGTQTLPPGQYRISRQREIDPDNDEARAVRD